MNVKLLRKAYDKAVQAKLSEFWFAGHLMDTSYVKYMLEYLEGPARV